MATRTKPESADPIEDGGGSPPDGRADDDRLVEKMEEVARRVVGELLGEGGAVGDGKPEGKGEPEKDEGPKSIRQEEHDTESAVRSVLTKIRAEDERDERLKKVEEAVAEKPPVQHRRSTRIMGWD